MIHGDASSGVDVLGLEDSSGVLHHNSGAALGRSSSLLGILAGGTAWKVPHQAASSVEIPLCYGAVENTGSH